MKCSGRVLGALAAAWLICQSAAMAQQQSPQDLAMDTLRTRQPTDLDDKIFNDWIDMELQQLEQAPAAAKAAAAQQFVQRFADQYNNEKNTPEFKQRFAERMAAIFIQELKKGAQLDTDVARAIARVMLQVQSIRLLDALLAGIQFPDDVVRYLSAQGLTAIQGAVAADARLAAQTIQTIAGIGANEANPVVAAELYRAISYPQHPEDSVNGILTMMDGRLKILSQPGVELDRGELPALYFLSSEAVANAVNAAKVEVVRRLAALLKIDVERYATPGLSDAETAAIEETIYEAEALMSSLVNVPAGERKPSITEKMQKGGPAAPIDMQVELNLWIGTPTVQGVLNKPPWNIPQPTQ